MSYRSGGFGLLPPVVKNLLILNGLFYLATFILETKGVSLSSYLGMYYFKSSEFGPWQIFSHMFMHGNFMHLFFNMFAVWMFGTKLEQVWGAKRFLFFYLFTALGAAFLHSMVIHYQVSQILPSVSASDLDMVMTEGHQFLMNNQNYSDATLGKLNLLMNIPVVGASGALFGILGGFAMLFPNTELMLIFFPVPIKAKYFVAIYGVMELFSGVANMAGDNVAHFAHIGGLVFGLILVKYWNKKERNHFY